MKTPSKRNRQVADLIRREIAMLMKTSISDPRLEKMMITTVDLAPNLSNARIFYILPNKDDNDQVIAALKKAKGFIRRALSSRVELRYTPQISFLYDDSIDRARQLLSLMDDGE